MASIVTGTYIRSPHVTLVHKERGRDLRFHERLAHKGAPDCTKGIHSRSLRLIKGLNQNRLSNAPRSWVFY